MATVFAFLEITSRLGRQRLDRLRYVHAGRVEASVVVRCERGYPLSAQLGHGGRDIFSKDIQSRTDSPQAYKYDLVSPVCR